jgi:hypothetical protein
LVVVVLAGCGSMGTPAPPPPVITTTTAPAPPASSPSQPQLLPLAEVRRICARLGGVLPSFDGTTDPPLAGTAGPPSVEGPFYTCNVWSPGGQPGAENPYIENSYSINAVTGAVGS